MNFLPVLQKPRRNFKFSNPLSGQTYNNNSFLKQCHYNLQEELIEPSQRALNPYDPMRQSNLRKTKRMSKTSQSWHSCCEKSVNKKNPEMVHTSPVELACQKSARENSEDKFSFTDIDVIILDALNSMQDLNTKILKINLTHYFGVYFKKTLLGYLTNDFIEIVEKYIQQLVLKKQLDHSIDIRDHPPDIFKINNKRVFVSRIKELEEKRLFNSAEAMVKFYCVPNCEFRESCYRDIIHMLSRSLFENFNMSKDKKFIILNEEGRNITELCEIKFSTTKMMITEVRNAEKGFLKYQNILNNNDMSFQRLNFSEGLKKTFRTRIMDGKVDETKPKDYFSQAQFAQKRLKRAEDILHRKSDKTLKIHIQTPSKTATNFSPAKQRQKSNEKKMRTKSTLLGSCEKRKIGQVEILPLSARKRNDKYREVFDKIIGNNSQYDITFNHLNQNRALMPSVIENYPLFKNKTKEQIERILVSLSIPIDSESIGWESFKKMNEVANCKGNKNDIIEFINKYLPFNEFGELDRNDLTQILKFILNGGGNREIVEEVIWSWFEKNELIENGVLLRTTLESWYEKNKLAYVMLISMIFGTNKISTIDLAFEVLV